MDSISPLAKILAEANGIDWRSIQGSGQGGSVVEQDILNYLSRVMSGDEEPPATPVDDLPEGWTGEMPPMPVNPSGLEALKAAGVESDITDFVDRQAQAAMPQAAAAQPVLTQPVAHTPAVQMPAVQMPATEPAMPAMTALAEPLVVGPVTPGAALAAPFGAPVTSYQGDQHPADPFAADPFTADLDAANMDADGEFELDDLNEDDLELDDLNELNEADLNVGSGSDWQAQPAAPLQPAAQVQHDYDPVEADSEADFVLADPLSAVDTPAGPSGLSTHAEAPLHDASAAALHADVNPSESPTSAPADVAFAAPVLPVPEVYVPEPQVAASEQDIPLLRAVAEEAEPVQAEPVQIQEAPSVPVEAAAVVATGAAGFGLGGFLSRLYGSKNAAPAEPLQTETVQPETVRTESVAAEYAEPIIGTAHAEPFVAAPAAPEVTVSETAAPETAAAEVMAPELEAPTPAWVPEPLLGEALVPQTPPIPDTPVAAPLVADQWRDQEAVVSEAEVQPIALPEAHEAEQPVAETEVVKTEVAETDVPVAEVPAHEADAPVDAPTLPAAAGTGATTLRLNVELSALETARAQLSEALYRDVPLPLLVARAAARSAGTLGLNGPVALGTHAGQALAADLSGDFRASLDDLKRPADAQPALLVLDAAELGLDELHRGDCSLSLGRSAEGQAALSLRGDLDPVRGAQFLHEVAGLLATPIRLLF